MVRGHGWRSVAAAGALGASSFAGLASGMAHPRLDPDVPHRVFVGVPPAARPAVPDRIPYPAGAKPRTAALPSSTRLPKTLGERWRVAPDDGLLTPAVVTAEGAVIVAAGTGDLIQLDAEDGRERWRRGLGDDVPAAAPVIASDGRIVLLTVGGELWRVSPREGRVHARQRLALDDASEAVPPLAREDGSLVVAAGRTALVVDAWGHATARATLPATPVQGLLAWRRGILYVGRGGEVVSWHPPGKPRVLGRIQEDVSDVRPLLVGPRTLIVVRGRRELVAFDLLTYVTTTSLVAPLPWAYDGTPTLARDTLLATTTEGVMMRFDPRGRERSRLALEPGALVVPPKLTSPSRATPDATRPSRVASRIAASPPVLADEEGTIVFARHSGRVGVIPSAMERDAPRASIPSLCAEIVGLQPAGPERVLVNCGYRTLVLLGSAAGPSSGGAPETDAPPGAEKTP